MADETKNRVLSELERTGNTMRQRIRDYIDEIGDMAIENVFDDNAEELKQDILYFWKIRKTWLDLVTDRSPDPEILLRVMLNIFDEEKG